MPPDTISFSLSPLLLAMWHSSLLVPPFWRDNSIATTLPLKSCSLTDIGTCKEKQPVTGSSSISINLPWWNLYRSRTSTQLFFTPSQRTMQLVEMEDNGLSASLLNSGEYRALVLGELTPNILEVWYLLWSFFLEYHCHLIYQILSMTTKNKFAYVTFLVTLGLNKNMKVIMLEGLICETVCSPLYSWP